MYLGCFSVINDAASVGRKVAWVDHTVVQARHLVSNRPDVSIIVERLAVENHMSNTPDGNNSHSHWELDVSCFILFQCLDLPCFSQAWSLLVSLMNTLWLLGCRSDIGDGGGYRRGRMTLSFL